MNNYLYELPANIEVEQALLGACLVNNKAMDAEMVSRIKPSHFSENIHAKIWEVMLSLKEDGTVANTITVKTSLPGDIKIGDMTAAQYLARLASEAVTIINAPDYAKTIIEISDRRSAISVAENMAFQAAKVDNQMIDVLRTSRDEVSRILYGIDDRTRKEAAFSDSIDATINKIEDRGRTRELIGINPGILEVSALTGQWESGQLIIIGSGPKQGKTSLSMQMLFTIAENHWVAANSGEMQRDQLIQREIARRTGISATRQKGTTLDHEEMNQIVRASAEMKILKVAEISYRRMTLDALEERVARLRGEYGIELFLLDHIGKLEWPGKMDLEEDWKKGQRATSRLKDIAMKNGIVMVGVTHLKKSAFGGYSGRSFREQIKMALNRKPTYQDLAGNMDKDADHVLIPFNAKPIIAGMEPEKETEEYDIWEEAMRKVEGHAEIILSLSRESEFPRRRDILWHGATTSFGSGYKEVKNKTGLFPDY